jgi:hypothetical protein
MLRQGIVSLAAAAVILHAPAEACVPVIYDTSGVSAQALAREMVENSRGVELMRVVSRAAVPLDRTHPTYRHFGRVYVYRFETVSVLNGRSRGPLELYGLDEDWLEQLGLSAFRRMRASLWWLTEEGYGALQETTIPDPADPGAVLCGVPATFTVGAEYLVFRDVAGALLAPGLRGRAGWRSGGPQRPVVERITDADDPWLREVRAAIAQNPKPGATFWEMVFELIFGRRQAER